MRRALFIVALLAPGGLSCLHDFEVEQMTFPCREDADCVEDFECDRSRWVCVPVGTSSAADAGTSTAGA